MGYLTMKRILCVMILLVVSYVTIGVINSTYREVQRFTISPSGNSTDHYDSYGDDQTCKTPKNNIFFLKTHKCASSTVQNILMRYGLKRDLNFVLPAAANYLGNPAPFNVKYIGDKLRTPDGKYNVFTHHTRYNTTTMHEVMYGDAKFVTIMRDPVALYESLYSYYNLKYVYMMSFKNLLKKPEKTITRLSRFMNIFGLNQMSWDLGLSPEHFKNMTYVEGLIEDVEKDFDLVMIAEQMEASLVLLSDLLCWSLEDVAFLNVNSRPLASHVELTGDERKKLRSLNSADNKLYQHFRQRFDEKVRNYGIERMERKVTQLLRINKDLYDTCVEGVQNPDNFLQRSVVYLSRSLEGEDAVRCRYSTLQEFTFTDEIRTHQKAKMASFK